MQADIKMTMRYKSITGIDVTNNAPIESFDYQEDEVLLQNLSFSRTYERFVAAANASFVLKLDEVIDKRFALQSEQGSVVLKSDTFYVIGDLLENRYAVVCIYLDGERYFTGFIHGKSKETASPRQISLTAEFRSKTADIMETTFIPKSFDPINGGYDYLTNGEISLINIIKTTLTKIGWKIIDPNGPDADSRFSDYNKISIIDNTIKNGVSRASKAIKIDPSPTGGSLETNISTDKNTATNATSLFTTAGTSKKTTVRSLTPNTSETVGAFFIKIANELGLMLTTNGNGDIVIDDVYNGDNVIPIEHSFNFDLAQPELTNIKGCERSGDTSQLFRAYYNIGNAIDDQSTPEKGDQVLKPNTVISRNYWARDTRHLAYNAGSTVNTQEQIAEQAMFASTMVARSNSFTLHLLSYRYVSKDDIQPVIIQVTAVVLPSGLT